MYLFRLLLAIWGFGLIGTTGELLLLEHFDGLLQVIPLAVLAIGFATSIWYVLRPGHASLKAFQVTLGLFAVSGLVGLFLHYRGNVEFERERDPTLHGLQLFWHAITGATPALAPGTMVFLALIGVAIMLANPVMPLPPRPPGPPFRTGAPTPH